MVYLFLLLKHVTSVSCYRMGMWGKYSRATPLQLSPSENYSSHLDDFRSCCVTGSGICKFANSCERSSDEEFFEVIVLMSASVRSYG